MANLLIDLLGVATLGAVVSSLVRLLLWKASTRAPNAEWHPVHSWLVLIPARAEGRLIDATLRSIRASSVAGTVEVLVILDGEDTEAARVVERYGYRVRIKEPPGPTKAAVLAWLVRSAPEELSKAEVLLLLDVGSTVSPTFFDEFAWPDGADAVQCFLRGSGQGSGVAAASSENFAQRHEDLGRQNLGWNIRLRGTGTAFRPRSFIDIAPRLITQIEDFEASLLLTAGGSRLMMAPPAAFVNDEKPSAFGQAALQRSRWLAGQLEVLIRHPDAFFEVIRRRTLEGIALLSEVFARPLALTIPFRVAVGGLLIWSGGAVRWSVALVLWASAVSDVILMRTAAHFSWRDSAALGVAWCRALLGVPRALFEWTRARRR